MHGSAFSRHGNLLLDSLDGGELESLGLTFEPHGSGTVLVESGEISAAVFFPCGPALVSVVRATKSGATVESGVIGSEGLFPIQTTIDDSATDSGGEILVQHPGTFASADADRLRALFRANAPFRDRVLRYTAVFLDQVTQNLICNRLHPIEVRLVKWLLVVHDRVGTDELRLTHEFLSHMLGVHRPGVSLAVGALEQDGLIHHKRGLVAIRDRAGLQARSCECFEVIRARLASFRAGFDSTAPYRHVSAASSIVQ